MIYVLSARRLVTGDRRCHPAFRQRLFTAPRDRTSSYVGKEGARASDLESSYRTMRAVYMLSKTFKTGKPDKDRLREFIARCRNDDGGYGVAPGQPSAVGSTYYAGIILHWLDEL